MSWTALQIVTDVISQLVNAERLIVVTGNVPGAEVTDPGIVMQTPDLCLVTEA
jgi:hypothetical protein